MGRPCVSRRLDRRGLLAKQAGLAEGGVVLVRPDGFIGFRRASADENAMKALDTHLSTYLHPDVVCGGRPERSAPGPGSAPPSARRAAYIGGALGRVDASFLAKPELGSHATAIHAAVQRHAYLRWSFFNFAEEKRENSGLHELNEIEIIC